MIDFSQPTGLSDAVAALRAKKLMPTSLSSADLAQMDKQIRQLSLFSARTTELGYLNKLQGILEDLNSGKINAAEARTQCGEWLQSLGYSAEHGFPGQPGAVPPAEKGAITDLSSEPRLNLMLDSNIRLLFNGGLMRAGVDPTRQRLFPAWELVRVYERAHERDETALSWKRRWVMAGGTLVDGRMIALKGDPIWSNLGDSDLFSDGMDTDAPPYWYNSGCGLREVSNRECQSLGLIAGAAPIASIDRSLIGKFFEDPDKATLGNLQSTRAQLQAAAQRLRAAA